METEGLAVLAFQPEAFDGMAQVLRGVVGWTVRVVPVKGEAFDAELLDVTVGDDGQYKAVVAPWDDAADAGDRKRTQSFDIYDELVCLEVL